MNADLRKLSSAGLRAGTEPQARRPALLANISPSTLMDAIRRASQHKTSTFPPT